MRLAQNLMNDGSTMELLRCGSRQLADFASAITKFVESGGKRALRCGHGTTRCLFPEEERSTKYDDDVVGKVLRSGAGSPHQQDRQAQVVPCLCEGNRKVWIE